MQKANKTYLKGTFITNNTKRKKLKMMLYKEKWETQKP